MEKEYKEKADKPLTIDKDDNIEPEESTSSLSSSIPVQSQLPVEKLAKYRTRLFLGEADFSYTKALVEKHDQKGEAFLSKITATEYAEEEHLESLYAEFTSNIDILRQKGVKVNFGVDAQSIHQHPELIDTRFKRIQFNCPHDGSNFKDATLPIIIKNFFLSAEKLQEIGDHIQVSIPKNPNVSNDKFRQISIYNIYEAASEAGYILLNKRNFGLERYPGYVHKQTNKNEKATVTENSREYIFMKTAKSKNEIEAIFPGQPKQVQDYTVKDKVSYKWGKALPIIDTDSDSSSYEDSETEIKPSFGEYIIEKSNQYKDFAKFLDLYHKTLTSDDLLNLCKKNCEYTSILLDYTYGAGNQLINKLDNSDLVELAESFGDKDYNDPVNEVVAPIIELLNERDDIDNCNKLKQAYASKQKKYNELEDEMHKLTI